VGKKKYSSVNEKFNKRESLEEGLEGQAIKD